MSDGLPLKPSKLEVIEKSLKKMESRLYEECTEVVQTAIRHTFELNPEQPNDIPAEWLEELELCQSEEERTEKLRELDKRKRIAQYALMPNKSAPVVLQLAAKVLIGMGKARASQTHTHQHLNLTYVAIPSPNQPIPQFPEKKIE
jgi:hypothetical protein